ncbi:unnamed protein product, partial [marine sediment metagenome]
MRKTSWLRHDVATAVSDFLVASGAGTFVKKTLAQTLTILGKAAASGLASLNAGSKVVQQPASITDHLDNTAGGTDAELSKAPTSNVMFDHAVTPPFDHLTGLLRSGGQLIIIPTIGWTEVENNVTIDQFTNYTKLTVVDAAGAGDGRAYIGTKNLNPGAWQVSYIDWDKELFFQFSIVRATVEATSPPLCYVQLKATNAAGALAADGLGIRIGDDGNDPHTADRKLYGES